MTPTYTELLRALEDGLSAFSTYPFESPEYREAQSRLRDLMTEAWGTDDAIRWDVTAEGLVWCVDEGRVPADLAPQLSSGLWRGGVSRIEFKPGAEKREVIDLLQVVQRAGTSQDDCDDLQSQLWHFELRYVHCDFHQEVPEEPTVAVGMAGEEQFGATVIDSPIDPAALRASIEADAATAGVDSRVVDIDAFDSTLYFLDESEIAYLKGEIEREYAQNLGSNVAALLMDTLEAREEPEVRTEVIGVLERLLPRLLEEGNFAAAIYLVSEAGELMQKAPGLVATHRKALYGLTERLSRPDSLSQLFQALEDAPILPSTSEFTVLLTHLRPQALPAILRWLGTETGHSGASLVLASVEQAVADQPAALSAALGAPDPVVLTQALRLFRKARAKECVKSVQALIAHPAASIRLLVVDALLSIGNASSCAALTKLIDDPVAEVRVAALNAVSVRGWGRAVDVIRDAIQAPDVVERSVSEQRAFFEAYGSLAGEAGIRVLRPILLGKTRTAKRAPDLRACAAVALGKIGTSTARQLLLTAEKDRNAVVRSAAGKALSDGSERT